MRPELTVPRASQVALDKMAELGRDAPEVELPEMPEMPETPEMPDMPEVDVAAPMFPELEMPERFPDQAGVDFADLPMAHLPDIFDMV